MAVRSLLGYMFIDNGVCGLQSKTPFKASKRKEPFDLLQCEMIKFIDKIAFLKECNIAARQIWIE